MPKGVYVRTEARKAELAAQLPRASFKGRQHSDEAKAKMRAAKLARPTRYWAGKTRGPHSEETRRKLSAAGTPVPFDVRQLAHAARRGSHHTAQSIAKIKAALARPEAKAKIRASVLGKPCRHAKREFWYNGRRFRSSYEVRTAAALDALGVAWRYESVRFDCGAFTYCPDFYIVADDAHWEVKGWYGPDSRRNVTEFRRLHPEVCLVVFDITCLESLEAAASKAA